MGTVHWTSVSTPRSSLRHPLVERAPCKERCDVITTAPRLLVIIADDLEAVGLPLASPTWNTDLVQGRWSMPSEEPPDENPSTEEDEPVLPPELQHPCDECEWIERSEGSLRGHKIMAHGYHAAENKFERFRGFLELISRFEFEFEFRRCGNYFLEGFEFVVFKVQSHTVAVHVPVLWLVCAHAIPFRMLWCL